MLSRQLILTILVLFFSLLTTPCLTAQNKEKSGNNAGTEQSEQEQEQEGQDQSKQNQNKEDGEENGKDSSEGNQESNSRWDKLPIHEPERVTPDSGLNFTPAAGVLGDGTLVLVYERISTVKEKRYLRAMRCKKIWNRTEWWQWTSDEQILKSDKFRNAPVLVPDDEGGLFLYFVAGKRGEKPYLIYRSHTTDGKNWSSPEALELELDNKVYKNPFVTRNSGDPSYLMSFTSGGHIYTAVSKDGKKWSDPTKIAKGNTSAIAAGSGKRVITYDVETEEGRKGRYRIWNKEKKEWGEEKNILNNRTLSHPTVSIPPSGTPEIYFISYAKNSRDIGYVQRVLLGKEDREPVQLTEWNMNEYRPRVLSVPAKHIHVDEKAGVEPPENPLRYLYWSRRTLARDIDVIFSRIKDAGK